MAAKDSAPPHTGQIVVRLLNSPLRGCEFLLKPGRTLFLVGHSPTLVAIGQLPELPADTLHIPLEQGGINFELLITADNLEHIILRELNDSGGQERSIALNQPLQVGSLTFALRSEYQSWSPEVLNTLTPLRVGSKTARNRVMAAFTLAALTLALLAGGFYWLWSTPQHQISELNVLLGQNSQRFQVLQGRNDVFYIVAHNERDSIWARQVIARGDYNRPAQVIHPAQENERITSWLAEHYPGLAYYKLQLDNPLHPKLWLSRQRAQLNEAQRQQLERSLAAIMPYAERVGVMKLDDAIAAQQAVAGLTRQALPYRRSDHPDSVTFVIQGALNDGELLRARRFVDDYYRQWGGRYVRFAIELKDDWLKEHSFLSGEQGYVKMSPGHWYFPKPRNFL
ncbi:type III secretion system protein PrgH [Chromobacterium amazonense]|uniref:Type III secretion system protein PrgH n=1 Tax=Chromobacterium amazonense TaxID=1382803 RepID=A0A2S9X5V3_9NEIS|nr:PrgH/EprH family type III secretion inner membrane ring protein [Chromobacterium amazonense]PRP71111.1 type III secretion system protein PrgH [Chromobacterium amazonense]